MKKLYILLIIIFTTTTTFSQSCLPDGIRFSNQQQIDDFQSNYPNCTEIEGNVHIHGNNITNLNGLIGVKKIIGNLDIHSNPDLINLSGFESLLYVGGDIYIAHNDALESVSVMNNLPFHNGNISIGGNSLILLEGFQKLDTLLGSLDFGHPSDYGYHGNPSLASISAFSNLCIIGGNLNLINNSALPSLGLDSLTSIGGNLNFHGNDVLTEIEFENLSTIYGSLIIGSYEGPRIQVCRGNSLLKNLDGLNTLTSIGGDLIILCNDSLVSLNGLGNINPHSIDDLWISDNPLLETCELLNICNYLSLNGEIVEIHDNAPGCNSQQEVEEACGMVGISEIHHESITIYPNPAANELFISSDREIIINEINIYNQLGQNDLHQQKMNNAIDVSMLQPGIYIVELVVGKSLIRKKLIIE